MHKIRNTAHLKLLNDLHERYKDKISKAAMRQILIANKWNEHAVIQEIKNDEWWYRFIDD